MKIRAEHAEIELTPQAVAIRRHGLVSFATHGFKGEKRIPYSSITSVQFRKPGMVTAGYIQFSLAGGNESGGGLVDASNDENTVMFGRKFLPQFEELRRLVEERMAVSRAPAPAPSAPVGSISEEIARLADLRSKGALTADEFDRLKAKLIG